MRAGTRAGWWAMGAPALVAAASLSACASVPSRPASVRGSGAATDHISREEFGTASWYGDAYNGRRTASGERFDMRAATAAHPSLPLPCWVEVTNLKNGRTLKVRVNDRLPRGGRVLDLSRGAAEQLGFLRQGITRVRIRYLGPAGTGATLVSDLSLGRQGTTLDLDAIADGELSQP